MNNNLDQYKTVQEAADSLGVQYFTLLSWIKKDIGSVYTDGLAVKKSSWLIHKDGVEHFRKMIKLGLISSETPQDDKR